MKKRFRAILKLRIELEHQQLAWFPQVSFERDQKAIQKAFDIR
jgi:hypothetical protein